MHKEAISVCIVILFPYANLILHILFFFCARFLSVNIVSYRIVSRIVSQIETLISYASIERHQSHPYRCYSCVRALFSRFSN